jgi:4-hydroxy-tetrahydrodipicolinate reductase
MSTKLVIAGVTGRMGQTLLRLLADDARFEVLGGIAHARQSEPIRIETPESAGDLLAGADVIIDFSSPVALRQLLTDQAAVLRGKALVVGTTGMGGDVRQLLDNAARESAVLVAANFSVGVNLLLGLAEAAARVLPAETYDVEIVEAHHRRKVDAPSGTAIALGEMIARGRRVVLADVRREGRSGETGARGAGEIAFHSLRGGDIVGEHHVHFVGMRERIELAHQAQDRAVFAEGALHAAQWLVPKPPGRYGMLDMLGLRSLP